MPGETAEPGADSEGREDDPAGNRRDRFPVGTGPHELRALHHTMRRRAGVGETREGSGWFGQRSYREGHTLPSTARLKGRQDNLGKRPLRPLVERLRIIIAAHTCSMGDVWPPTDSVSV